MTRQIAKILLHILNGSTQRNGKTWTVDCSSELNVFGEHFVMAGLADIVEKGTKKIPTTCQKEPCEDGLLIPKGKKAGLLYFERTGSGKPVKQQGKFTLIEETLRLVVWADPCKFGVDKCCDVMPDIMRVLLARLNVSNATIQSDNCGCSSTTSIQQLNVKTGQFSTDIKKIFAGYNYGTDCLTSNKYEALEMSIHISYALCGSDIPQFTTNIEPCNC